jgi:short subunit dehydrogenase-like uncharacterized protein
MATTAQPQWMLYGATGYTGVLIAEEAVRRGLRPVLAGRNADKLRPLAERLGLSFRAFGLDRPDPSKLEGVSAVVHAAGPFIETSQVMVSACLEAGAHYLDITGELPVFRSTFARDAEAKKRKVALISGVGFDVVPTDCLAVHLAQKLPNALTLEIALWVATHLTAGTAKSTLRQMSASAVARRNGEVVTLPVGKFARKIRFLPRERWVVPLPIGDIETAWRSTRIPNITTYGAVPRRLGQLLTVAWPAAALSVPALGLLFSVPELQKRADAFLERKFPGPNEQLRHSGKMNIWARVTSPSGGEVEGWLETAEAYQFTGYCAVSAVEKVLKDKPVGALAPAQALGADFVLSIPGTRRVDGPLPATAHEHVAAAGAAHREA